MNILELQQIDKKIYILKYYESLIHEQLEKLIKFRLHELNQDRRISERGKS